MSELLFCNKCGAVSCSNTIGDLCSSCLKGNLIGTTINFSKAYAEVIVEYKKTIMAIILA